MQWKRPSHFDQAPYEVKVIWILLVADESVRNFEILQEQLADNHELRFDIRWRETALGECRVWQKLVVDSTFVPMPPPQWVAFDEKFRDAMGLLARSSKDIVEGVEHDNDKQYARGIRCKDAYFEIANHQALTLMPMPIEAAMRHAADWRP